MIRITSKRAGFWRCGVAHPATPTDHPAGRFTAEELERLRAEPMLTVQEIGDEAEGEGPEGTASEQEMENDPDGGGPEEPASEPPAAAESAKPTAGKRKK